MRDLMLHLAEARDFPANDDGQIVSPLYCQPKYLETLRTYCRTTPRERWPGWLRRDFDLLDAKRTAPARRRAREAVLQ